jgi:hypothetical protein
MNATIYVSIYVEFEILLDPADQQNDQQTKRVDMIRGGDILDALHSFHIPILLFPYALDCRCVHALFQNHGRCQTRILMLSIRRVSKKELRFIYRPRI